MSKDRFGLPSLIRPLSRQVFMRAHWLRRPVVSHGPLARFGALSRIRELRDMERLCAAARGPVTVFGKKGRQRDLERAADALPFYEEGDTIYFRRLQESIPALAELSAALARDFALWPQDVAVEAFASRDGAGTRMHFDSEQNFNVQLRGRKTWRLCPNAAVADPLQSFVAGGEPSLELESYARGPFPKRMPKAARALELREGSALYVPRGYWHETSVRGDSFAVCFAVKPPAAVDVLLSVLRRSLIQDSAWREGVYGLAGTSRERAGLRERLVRMLPDLSSRAAALDARGLVPEAAAPGPAFRWRAQTRAQVSPSEDGDGDRWIFSVRARGAEPLLIEIDESLVPLARWMSRQPRRMRPPYEDPEFSDLPAAQIHDFFRALAGLGALVKL